MKTCWLALLLSCGPALAFTDPTQPPPAALQHLAASGAQTSTTTPPVPMPMRLQGLRPGHSALIDGQLRRVGQQWQGHHLLRADAHVAWLRDPEGRLLRLSLLPAAPVPVPEKKRP